MHSENQLLYACSLVVVWELSFGEKQASWRAEYTRATYTENQIFGGLVLLRVLRFQPKLETTRSLAS